MGAAIIILLILGGVAVVSSPAPSKPKPEEDLPAAFPAGAKVQKDRWWGPFRIVTYKLGDEYGWIAQYHRAAMDEYGPEHAQEAKIEAGYDTADLAEAGAIMWAQNQVSFEEHAGLLVLPLVEHQREDGSLYRSWMVQRGPGESALVSSLRTSEGPVFPTEWKVHTRASWPAHTERGKTSGLDEEIWTEVAKVV